MKLEKKNVFTDSLHSLLRKAQSSQLATSDAVVSHEDHQQPRTDHYITLVLIFYLKYILFHISLDGLYCVSGKRLTGINKYGTCLSYSVHASPYFMRHLSISRSAL